MSIGSIIQTMFGGPTAAPVQQPVQQAPAQPGNLPATPPASNPVQTAGTANNGVVPNNPATNDPAKSGLDQFNDLWNTSNNGQQGQPLFNVSQEKMLAAARQQNFTSGINPELAAKVTAGGPEAMQAMLEIMNDVGQRVYAQSAFAGTRLIEGALDKSNFARSSDLDTRFKSMSVANSLQAENPMFSHPAAKPMLDNIQSSLLLKHPNATPAELTQMAKTYLNEFVTAFKAPETQQQQQQQQATAAASGQDWGKFFGS